MARRHTTQRLSSFSWKKEAKTSEAKQRLSRRTGIPTARSKGHRSVWRVIAYSIILAVLMAAIVGVTAIKWPEIIRFYHGLAYRSAEIPFLASQQREDFLPGTA